MAVSTWKVLALIHLVSLAWAVGAATVKVVLLVRCRSDAAFVPVYLAVVRTLTRHIVLGLALLTLSGVGWLVMGYPMTGALVAKLVLVGVIWALGPVIDKVVEPRFVSSAQAAGGESGQGFAEAWRRYLTVELAATGAFYVVIAVWVLK